MSVLILVRHGQASLFAEDYDLLSPIGEQQARLLGEHWAKQGIVIDQVYSGPRRRQQRSAELAGEAYQKAGFHWPEPVCTQELDEYDLNGLETRLALRLIEQDPEFARLFNIFRDCTNEADRPRHYQRMFESLTQHWQNHSVPGIELETWPEFRQRVNRFIRSIQQEFGRGRRVAMFTSGGVIGCATQQALGVSDRMMLELNWRLRNCSLTEFLFTPERFTLDAFNTIPHLTDAACWTYR